MIYAKTASASASRVKTFRVGKHFNYRVVGFQKQYPDTFLQLKVRGIPVSELRAGQFYQLNLYSSDLQGLPDQLFTDKAINWHSQQLGEKGLIAAAGLYAHGSSLIVCVMQSDLCQQLYRSILKQECKTRVENRFRHWYTHLFNAILDFAIDAGFSVVYTPTSNQILATTPKRIRPDLFRRIYDAPAARYDCKRVRRDGAEYWKVTVASNAEVVERLPAAVIDHREDKQILICILHDIEENVDTRISVTECRDNLTAMLEIEKSLGINATYNILGRLLYKKRKEILAFNSHHCLAFHSYDHDISDQSQLARCREVDLQVRGYRPPRSVITPELTDYRLSFFNFEWLASYEGTFGFSSCALQNGIVKIPIQTDDHPLFVGTSFSRWEADLLSFAKTRRLLAFGLHDCYAGLWLKSYRNLLEKLGSIGRFVTGDEVCDRVFWQIGTDLALPRRMARRISGRSQSRSDRTGGPGKRKKQGQNNDDTDAA
jgi:hypothetical protein